MSDAQSHIIDIQDNSDFEALPTEKVLERFATCALSQTDEVSELTLRFVAPSEITALNSDFRKKDKATNVLSFPSNLPSDICLPHQFLGDVIVCPEVVATEADEQGKSFENHLAHIIIHGILHLLGYDHIKEKDANVMEPLEIQLLATLDISNPYKELT